jgi:catechol 2,3-dioxygenase-like lactoylglutathione lyase family enzyme
MAKQAKNQGLIHHLEFYVSDLQETLAFWSWLFAELGYKKYQEWDKGQSWKLGNTYIGFLETEKDYKEPSFHRKRTGLNHIAFTVSQDDLEAIKTKLIEKEIALLYEDQNITDAIFFEDPDRIKIELAAY